MKNSQENPIFMQAEVEDEGVWGKGCGCFNLFCLKRRRSYNHINESNTLLHQRGEQHTEEWWKCKLNKLKQFSEKVAGPKWKNFIRKMGGYCDKRKDQKNRFQYDPCSYALNFDEGDDKEADDLLRGFSSRFTAPFEHDRQRVPSGL
ncbi:hypothetical protein ERO13_A06G050000v2 [Gossypium hirsutum]|uniref:Stress induced protein n=5 Tax=Gossypium TaxID=3633 RepID=A0A2P5W8P6_GOSBA|nr:uncharacterized protein LOC107962556 [Gossypium hirsutum]XP_017632074.1 uncharacterized protein LOC108474607 [Gossypium arboreum]KAB2076656.1 hypothetical protein ES319_A06G055900v1 [Gossypium barbadense]TYH12348.1 hypothetical protein ES288_A06G061000v1 [Gossypium darwinii]TYJ29199.1 hypothetical protein E1A91_A06G054700v1 [Gossypium mustelinum]KAG4194363.1 hypothetical protein ERO13_A06G050000v2 [Gossypium hirsutum]KAK5824366.1 hypothetical protein PVK06_019137 [Gossypium arboreum]